MAVLVIPARYASKRLPGKPLLAETGKALIVHVMERASRAEGVTRVVVATDDERIRDAVKAAGGEVVLTSAEHTCGTERVAEVAKGFPKERLFVNLQGDEPEIEPSDVELVVRTLAVGGTDVSTLAAPLSGAEEFRDPSVVKVVTDAEDRALYFSRAPIPHVRDAEGPEDALRHIGIYGYTRDALARFARLPPSRLERLERLEQLRALEDGMIIRVARVAKAPPGIDTIESYRAFVRRVREAGNSD